MAGVPKYEVIRTCWIDQPDPRSDTGFAPKLLRPGEKNPVVVRYNGWPNAALKPLDAEGERRAAIVEEYRKAKRQLPATVEKHDEQAKAAKAAVKAATKAPKAEQVAA